MLTFLLLRCWLLFCSCYRFVCKKTDFLSLFATCLFIGNVSQFFTVHFCKTNHLNENKSFYLKTIYVPIERRNNNRRIANVIRYANEMIRKKFPMEILKSLNECD